MGPMDGVRRAAAEFLGRHRNEVTNYGGQLRVACVLCGENCEFRYDTVESLLEKARKNEGKAKP